MRVLSELNNKNRNSAQTNRGGGLPTISIFKSSERYSD